MSRNNTKRLSRSGLYLLCVVAMLFTQTPAWALVTETLKLVPEDPQIGSFFGQQVAIGGGAALVASPEADSTGAAYVFDTNTGTQLFKLTPDDLFAGDQFSGGAMTIANGRAYIGGGRDLTGTSVIWIFDLTSGLQVGKLTPEDVDATTTFGSEIAIHGNTAIIGATTTDVGGFEGAGSAYLFDIPTGNQIAKLTSDTPMQFGSFGNSVAIDASYAAVNAGGSNQVYLFDSLTGLPIADFPGPSISAAGDSLALNGDRLLLGTANISPGDDGVRLYDISDPLDVTFDTLSWPQPGPGLFFGKSVALSNSAMLVSTWFSDDINASGIVHMFNPDTGDLLDSFRSSDAAVDDVFGQSIGLDGQTLIVGAPGEPTTTGAAYLFTIPEPTTIFIIFATGLTLVGRRHKQLQSANVR